MTKRTHTAHILAAYFEEKGHIFSQHEYKEAKDAPVRLAIVKKTFGSWNRMETIVRGFNIRNQQRDEREPLSDVDEVIRNNAAAETEYAEKMKAASENLEVKTAREEAARKYIEADKLNAASAQGAYENKMRKGGITSQDEKAKKEAVEQALAEEHAMLAQTGAGAALGKHLLGGVEDNDEKTRVIAEQNAMRTKTKLMAATPLGAAEAKLIEDDTDGQLTREAQARIRNELRTFVPPTQKADTDLAVKNASQKVREDVRAVVEAAAGDENIMTDSVFKATIARERLAKGADTPVSITAIPEDIMKTMPPTSQLPEEGFGDDTTEFKDKDGKVTAKREEADNDKSAKAQMKGSDGSSTPPKPAEKDKDREKARELSEGEKKANEKNPAAPPATRNPDPKFTGEGAPEDTGDQKQNNKVADDDNKNNEKKQTEAQKNTGAKAAPQKGK